MKSIINGSNNTKRQDLKLKKTIKTLMKVKIEHTLIT
jgi:hypothetical protein